MSLQTDKATVLIVDDEPLNVRALANLLKQDYHILVATEGRKALELATTQTLPDLILLDVEMPELDGYELCRRLKSTEHTSSIPVVFVTGRSAVDDEEKGFALGAVDYISKPFHPAIIRARVRNHVNLKIKTDRLEILSLHDGLTNLPNRRRFDQRLIEEWGRTLRTGQCLSLLMMDIDHFKAYNDHYGHGAGDDCLCQVARSLESVVARSVDLVARYGGEEFVALLPGTDYAGARYLAEQFRAAVEALAIPHQYSSVAKVVTLSVGVATRCKDDAEALLRSADRALYCAKAQGRNRVDYSDFDEVQGTRYEALGSRF